jgi:hypothetical protein
MAAKTRKKTTKTSKSNAKKRDATGDFGDPARPDGCAAGVFEHPNGRRWTISLYARRSTIQQKLEGAASEKSLRDITEGSQYAMWRRARQLVEDRLSEGFRVLRAGEPEPEQSEDADHEPIKGRFITGACAGLLDPNRSGTPHGSFERDLRRIYVASRFPGCKHPPGHLLTLDLGRIEAFPKAIRDLGKLHVLYPQCSGDCWMLEANGFDGEMHFAIESDGLLRLLAARRTKRSDIDDGEPRDEDEWPYCEEARPPHASGGIGRAGVYLVPARDVRIPPFVIGGVPKWLQSDANWPDCVECRKPMFFVAQLSAIQLGCGDQWLYVFACERCRTMAVTMQTT